jgi:Na+/glutamate symporter
MATDYHHPDYEEWVIRVCDCGFPLGATLAAIQLVRCPDCNRMTIPVEDVTRSVHVVNVEKPSAR